MAILLPESRHSPFRSIPTSRNEWRFGSMYILEVDLSLSTSRMSVSVTKQGAHGNRPRPCAGPNLQHRGNKKANSVSSMDGLIAISTAKAIGFFQGIQGRSAGVRLGMAAILGRPCSYSYPCPHRMTQLLPRTLPHCTDIEEAVRLRTQLHNNAGCISILVGDSHHARSSRAELCPSVDSTDIERSSSRDPPESAWR